jgi:hypothetical protein
MEIHETEAQKSLIFHLESFELQFFDFHVASQIQYFEYSCFEELFISLISQKLSRTKKNQKLFGVNF